MIPSNPSSYVHTVGLHALQVQKNEMTQFARMFLDLARDASGPLPSVFSGKGERFPLALPHRFSSVHLAYMSAGGWSLVLHLRSHLEQLPAPWHMDFLLASLYSLSLSAAVLQRKVVHDPAPCYSCVAKY